MELTPTTSTLPPPPREAFSPSDEERSGTDSYVGMVQETVQSPIVVGSSPLSSPRNVTTNSSDYVKMGDVEAANHPDDEITQADCMDDFAKAFRDEDSDWWLTASWISIGAILGSLLRIAIAQVFGQTCANPDSAGWLKAASPLCVTADGTTQQQGGIVFADLPSNLLGSFCLGLLQDSAVLHLAVPMAIAWLPPHHRLQRASILITALKTGFCGSLTTFSSWNAEMVVMIFGDDKSLHSQLWSALFGYIIGMETSLGSYACGCSVARRLHKVIAPSLAAEAHAARAIKSQGIFINQDLPDLERRFLSSLPLQQDLQAPHRMEALTTWKRSTQEGRRVGSPHLEDLIAIENAILVLKQTIPAGSEAVARANQWALDSLLEYASQKLQEMESLPKVSTSVSLGSHMYYEPHRKPFYMNLPLVCGVLGTILVLCLLGIVLINDDSASSNTNRTMMLAMLLAPTGALLRWNWSKFNKGMDFLPRGWEWLPAGTFLANMIGSVISITAVALEYRIEQSLGYNNAGFWTLGTIRAVKVGFAGCLTTVSTFVSEVSAFMHQKTDHAYPYIFITLVSACLLACTVYGMIVHIL